VDWATISALATGGGTLVLAIATFGSVKSANRAARAAEHSLLAGLRPLLVPSRLDDSVQKVGFIDGKWLVVPGGQGATEITDGAVYLAASLRNVGSGIAVLHGWKLTVDIDTRPETPDVGTFTRLSRDIYIPAGDTGFWQGSFRDPGRPDFTEVKQAIESRSHFTVDVLYGDYEGGQRVVSRFAFTARSDEGWILSVGRHWNIDNPNPR
jgi:hypothetical protein